MRRGVSGLLAILVFSMINGTVHAGLFGAVEKTDITPPTGFDHSAIGIMKNKCWLNTGVHDPVEARVLVLSDGDKSVSIVSLDLLGFDPERVRMLLPDSLSNTLFCASHNHLGPATINFRPPDFRYESTYLNKTEQSIAEAVIRANNRLEPITIGSGCGSVALSYNKLGGGKGLFLCGQDNPDRIRFVPEDPEVGVIRIDKANGKPLAVIVNYASHPVCVWLSDKVSSGYPGVMRRKVEAALGNGTACLFIQGGCGDTQPFESCMKDWGASRRVGTTLAEEVLRVHALIKPSADTNTSIDFHTETITLTGRNEAKGLELSAEMSVLMINKAIAFACCPGEFFVDFQLELKRRSPVKSTFLAGYTNGYLGYFPTIQAVDEDWNGQYDHNMWVERGSGEKMIHRAIEVISRLHNPE